MGESLGAQDALIINHIPLAMKIARYRGNKDVFISAALFGLVQAVRWLDERCKENDPEKYIAGTIRRFVYDAINECYVVDRPRGKIASESIKQETDDSLLYKGVTQNHEKLIIEEILNKFTSVEQKIISLRMDGWTLEEIAEEYGTSRSDIHRRLKQIKKRLML